MPFNSISEGLPGPPGPAGPGTFSEETSIISVRDYGATGNGVTGDRDAIYNAIAATNNRELLFPAGMYRVESDLTFGSTVAVRFLNGAKLSIDSGVTVTINGALEAGLYQVFSGDGLVNTASGSIEYVFPEWWGAIADNSTDCRSYIQSALDSGDIPVKLGAGTYRISGSINIDTKDKICGCGKQSVIKYTDGGSTFSALIAIMGAPYALQDIVFADFAIDGNGSNRTDIAAPAALISLWNCKNVLIENLKLYNSRQGGIELSWNSNSSQKKNVGVKIVNCSIDTTGYQTNYVPEGILISAGDDILIQGCTFRNIGKFYGINVEYGGRYGLRNVRIVGNDFENCKDGGIQIKNGHAGEDIAENILIDGNTINAIYHGIRMGTEENHIAKDVVISDNVINCGTTLSRGEDDTKIGSTAFGYRINSIGYWRDQEIDGTDLAPGNIPASKWAVFKFEIGADGMIDCLGNNNGGLGYDTEAVALAALPATSSDHVAIGAVTVQASASAQFVPGADALEGGSSGNPAQAARYYPLPVSDGSGIYGSNFLVTGNLIKGFAYGIRILSNGDAHGNLIEHCGVGIQLYGADSIIPPYNPANKCYSVQGNRIMNCAIAPSISNPCGIHLQNGSIRGTISGNLIDDTVPSASMLYGIYDDPGGTNRVAFSGNYIKGWVTNPINSSSRLHDYDHWFSSMESVNLSVGTAQRSFIFRADKYYTLCYIVYTYTEATSADAGVLIGIGKSGSDTYFHNQTSGIGKSLWAGDRIVTSSLSHLIVEPGDTLFLYTAGGKTGTGKLCATIGLIPLY